MRFFRKLGVKLARTVTLLVGLLVAAALIGTSLIGVGKGAAELRSAVSFAPGKVDDVKPLDERSQVFDRYGNIIATWRGVQNRVPVALSKVPPHLIQAVLDMEDSQFYRHLGINGRALVRATAANVEAGGVAQGGSTITQQLVKLSYLSSKQDVNRKIREALISYRFEKKYTKAQILELYLNTVYFGEGSYGVQAAAERYFAKPVEKLTVVESAFLAGMIRNPNGYNPVKFRDRSRRRRNVVLARMESLGHITKAEFDAGKREQMPRPADRLVRKETYFLEAVKQELLDDPRLGETDKDRYNAVFSGGLKVKTTFDPVAQDRAERAVRDRIGRFKDFTAALVAVEVQTGAVRALVGGRGFETDKYNLATQGRRQPGSSFKPIVLIAALEKGISPKSTVNGAQECPIPNPNGKPNPYRPKNSSEGSGGQDSILSQLVKSSNCAYARLAYVTGLRRVADVAKRLGITTKIPLVPSMALGAVEVHPIDMAGVYATIAAEGKLRKPYLVEEVRDRNGKLIFSANKKDKQVIDKQAARVAIGAMRRVVTDGTGTAAALEDHQAAGKTGTTNSNQDAWFVGFTSQLATAVWMGAPDRKLSMSNVGGVRVIGGSYPAEIWHDFMAVELRDDPAVPLPGPDPELFKRGECVSVEALVEQDRAQLRAFTQLRKQTGKVAEQRRRNAEKAQRQTERDAREAARKKRAAAQQAAEATGSASGLVSGPVRGFSVWMSADLPTPDPQPVPQPQPEPQPEPRVLSPETVPKRILKKKRTTEADTGASNTKRRRTTVSTKVRKRTRSTASVDTEPTGTNGTRNKRSRLSSGSSCSMNFDFETTMPADALAGSTVADTTPGDSGDSSESRQPSNSKRHRSTKRKTSADVPKSSRKKRKKTVEADPGPSPAPRPDPSPAPAPDPAPAPPPEPAPVPVVPQPVEIEPVPVPG